MQKNYSTRLSYNGGTIPFQNFYINEDGTGTSISAQINSFNSWIKK
jgi:hypothetical protein